MSATDLTRSWHGTSVQCVQPHPLSGHLTGEDMPNPGPVIASNSGKHALSSPIGTPIAVEKSKRRKQSLTEGTLTSPHTVSVHPELTCDPNLQTEYEHPTRTLCLEQLRLDATEQSVLRTLRVDLFHSILLRTFGSSKPLRLRPYYSSKPLRLRPYFFKPFRKHITPNTLAYIITKICFSRPKCNREG